MRLAAIVAASAALAAPGCGSGDGELRFTFTSRAPSGFIDQTLDIANDSDRAVAPTLEIVPLDGDGERVPGVTVRTAFGSHRGQVVLPPRTELYDVLRFDGARRYDVEDVEVHVAASEPATAEPLGEEVDAERLGRSGDPVEDGTPFDAVRVNNPADAPIRVRTVLIEYEAPPEGEPQQFLRTTPVGGLIEVGARGNRIVRLPARLRGRVIGSAKAFPSR